jgi:hypothetical protein
MSAHKFRIGQRVNYRPVAPNRTAPVGVYQIIRFLPHRKGSELEYQIKNLNVGHVLVAKESELRSA